MRIRNIRAAWATTLSTGTIKRAGGDVPWSKQSLAFRCALAEKQKNSILARHARAPHRSLNAVCLVYSMFNPRHECRGLPHVPDGAIQTVTAFFISQLQKHPHRRPSDAVKSSVIGVLELPAATTTAVHSRESTQATVPEVDTADYFGNDDFL